MEDTFPDVCKPTGLRDYFAAKAMQSMLGCKEAWGECLSVIEGDEGQTVIDPRSRRRAIHAFFARRAYMQADAMLAAREAK